MQAYNYVKFLMDLDTSIILFFFYYIILFYFIIFYLVRQM